MKSLRVITIILLAIVVMSNIFLDSKFIYADDYPVDSGEKIVGKRIINKDRVEIFTRKNDCIYIKKLKRKNNHWNVTSSKKVDQQFTTGLKIREGNINPDNQLSNINKDKLGTSGIIPIDIPSKVDFSESEYLPPVDKQSGNSCVGWALGYYLRTYQQARDIGWKVKQDGKPIKSHVFSPAFIYNQINGGVDEGAYMDSACNLLQTIGAATLEQFPYTPGDYISKPTQIVIQNAFPNRVSNWSVLFTDNDTSYNIIQRTKEYLRTGDLVAVGTRIGYNFLSPYIDDDGKAVINSEDGYYVTQQNKYLQHEYIVVGYDDTLETLEGKGAFKLINSWGDTWGDKGFSYISYQAYTAGSIHGYVFTDLINRIQKPLTLGINENVIFSLELSGEGRYDYNIKDENNKLVFEQNRLKGKIGINTILWNGYDLTGGKLQDGPYNLSIIPYNQEVPGEPFNLSFTKESKVLRANCIANIYENNIYYVEIPITTKLDGILNIKVCDNVIETNIISNQPVKSGETKVYKIKSTEFDFSNVDVNNIKILIEVK
jgi:hypothetical protein